jgi:hypothetical protein
MINEILQSQIMLLIGGLLLTCLGASTTFSKKFYMRLTEQYRGDDVEAAYDKLSRNHRLYFRYRFGVGGLCFGIMLLVVYFWMTFFN